MHFDYLFASYNEAVFCTKHYQPDQYWRDHKVELAWCDVFNMGNEI